MLGMPGTWDGLDSWIGFIVLAVISVFAIRACRSLLRPTVDPQEKARAIKVKRALAIGGDRWVFVAWVLLAAITAYSAALGTVRWWLWCPALILSVALIWRSGHILLHEGAVPGVTSFRWIGADLMIPGAGGGALSILIGVGLYAGFAGPGTKNADLDPTDPNNVAALLKYAESLTYDTRHRSMDQKWLTAFDPQRKRISGPLGTLTPEKNANRNGIWDLTGKGKGHGRIIARIQLEAPYPKLDLPAGTSYMWVDDLQSVSPARGDTVATFRMLIISKDSAKVFTPHSASGPGQSGRGFVRSTRVWSNHAIAKWTFDPRDECDCADCLPHGYQCVWC